MITGRLHHQQVVADGGGGFGNSCSMKRCPLWTSRNKLRKIQRCKPPNKPTMMHAPKYLLKLTRNYKSLNCNSAELAASPRSRCRVSGGIFSTKPRTAGPLPVPQRLRFSAPHLKSFEVSAIVILTDGTVATALDVAWLRPAAKAVWWHARRKRERSSTIAPTMTTPTSSPRLAPERSCRQIIQSVPRGLYPTLHSLGCVCWACVKA